MAYEFLFLTNNFLYEQYVSCLQEKYRVFITKRAINITIIIALSNTMVIYNKKPLRTKNKLIVPNKSESSFLFVVLELAL